MTSGILIHQTGPDGDITQVPVLSFIPQPTHPSTGACWAEVMYFSGRTELPLAAVISFHPGPHSARTLEHRLRPTVTLTRHLCTADTSTDQCSPTLPQSSST